MAITADSVLSALRLVLRLSHVVGPDDLPDLVSRAAGELGASAATIFVVDYDQLELLPLVRGNGDGRPADAIVIEGTLAGRAFTEIAQYSTTGPGTTTVWVPMVDGTDRLGLLQLEFPPRFVIDESVGLAAKDLAALIAELVSTRSVYGDAVQRTRRRRALTVPAELQWTMLPPLTFASPRVAVAGVVAPTAEVAGDCFDYALNGDTLHV
ncbi:MAG: Protein icfG, partial [Frankiales bacterium]|nr:Protein icfG [Frankiales bacterium]